MVDRRSNRIHDEVMINAHPVQVFSDNYVWVLSRTGAVDAVIVDPGEAAPVIADLLDHDLKAQTVLLTHHHHDHVGGAREVAARFGCPVYGPAEESIAAVDRPVTDGDTITVEELGLSFDVLSVPGHTSGHIAYRIDDILLCGDTLFAGGCGRIFEGTAPQMYHSLQRLATLPPDTLAYCAHEYTQANLQFALAVEPGNKNLHDRVAACRRIRSEGRPTVPSTIAEELETNPFLRCEEPEIVAAASQRAGRRLEAGAEVFREIRAWKDNF